MNSQSHAKTYGPYSPVRQAGNLYFVSGQVGIDLATNTVSGDAKTQAEVALKNLEAVLAEVSLTLNDIVKTTIYLTDMGDFADVNDVYVRHFSEPRPARATVAVQELPRLAGAVPLKVEIEAIAAKDAS